MNQLRNAARKKAQHLEVACFGRICLTSLQLPQVSDAIQENSFQTVTFLILLRNKYREFWI